MQLQVSHCILLLSVFHTSLKKYQFSSPERGQKLCCFLHGSRENHHFPPQTVPLFFALFCIWMSSQMLICLLVLVAVLGGLVDRLSSKLFSFQDYTERKCMCWMSVFGIYCMKKNLFALIWNGHSALAGIWRNLVSVDSQNNTEIWSYCKASYSMRF